MIATENASTTFSSLSTPPNTKFVHQARVAALALGGESDIIPCSYKLRKHLGSRYALTSTCNNTNTRHTPIIIDTGASISICCCIDDVIGDLRPSGAIIQGIGSSLSVGGIGTVAWTVFDIHNVEVTIKTEAFYVS